MTLKTFQDKHVVVTGGALGIGRAIVEAFAGEGAHVAFADIDEESGKKTCKEVYELTGNPQVMFYRADLSDGQEVCGFVEYVLRWLEYVDVLVNNVGINFKSGNILEHSIDDFQKTLDLNVMSYIRCIKGFLPTMVQKKQGVIINISSTMAFGAPGFPAYSMSKGSIVTLTKSLALDHASQNIRVNAVAPGLIETPATQPWINQQKNAAQAKGVPMGIVGKPQDIANAVLFLASEKASYITGHVLVVDGGLSIGE